MSSRAAIREELTNLAGSIRAKVRNLRVLNAGWEGGSLPVLHEGRRLMVDLGKAGGMGVVIPELPGALMQYAQARGLTWRVDNAAPLFGDLIAGRAGETTWSRDELERAGILTDTRVVLGPFRYGASEYTVRVWRIDAETHTQYLFEQPALWGRVAVHYKDGHAEPDIYGVPEGEDCFPQGEHFPSVTTNYAMAEFERRRYVIFSRAAAAWYAHGQYNLLIGNDYHVGLAPFYDPDILQLTIGHNLGYQGVDALYFQDRRTNRRIPISGDSVGEQVEAYCERVGVSPVEFYEYFLAFRSPGYVGTPIWLQAILRLNFNRCGLAATTVSQNYADQLRLTRSDIEQKIRAARDFIPSGYFEPEAVQQRIRAYWDDHTDDADLFIPNRNLLDLTRYYVVGVLNGLGLEKHLRYDTPLLRRLGFDTVADRPLEQRIQNAAELTAIKAAARRALFKDKRLADRGVKDGGQALHVAWGRLVAQKGFHIILEEVEHITLRREEVLVVVATAPAGDKEGLYIEQRFTELAERCPNFVFVNAFDPAFARLARVAADLVHVTSKYEPCGLTDVEAYWSGTLCVVHKVGGLTKGIWDEYGYGQVRELDPRGEPVAFGYDAYDTSDPIGEARAFRRAYEALINFKQQNPEHFAALQFKALGMLQFTYAIPANRYIDLIQYVFCFQFWRKLRADVHAGRLAAEEGVEEMCSFLESSELAGCMYLDDDPARPTRHALFRDVFRPPDMYYVDEVDRMLDDAL
ncbi:MAG: glycosyltransferase [Anaerolineae bacterium]|nr:glycosyltransferase [Anaerolineae bacterium]